MPSPCIAKSRVPSVGKDAPWDLKAYCTIWGNLRDKQSKHTSSKVSSTPIQLFQFSQCYQTQNIERMVILPTAVGAPELCEPCPSRAKHLLVGPCLKLESIRPMPWNRCETDIFDTALTQLWHMFQQFRNSIILNHAGCHRRQAP